MSLSKFLLTMTKFGKDLKSVSRFLKKPYTEFNENLTNEQIDTRTYSPPMSPPCVNITKFLKFMTLRGKKKKTFNL